MRAFSNCHAELVSASHETLKQVQGDKEESIIKQPLNDKFVRLTCLVYN